MQVRHDALSHFPINRVYDVFLTGMEQLPPWLPCIDRIDISADLHPYPERLPGLPRWLAKKGLPLVEKLIGDILKLSLPALPDALQAITAIAESTGNAQGFHVSEARAGREARHV